MNIENFIETKHRELITSEQVNSEFNEMYKSVEHPKLRELFVVLHDNYVTLFRTMNNRLPTNEISAHFWAIQSRQLITTIETTLELYNALMNTVYQFEIDEYYLGIIKQCRDFLSMSWGSTIPPSMSKIELYYTTPIFVFTLSVKTPMSLDKTFPLKLIGNGSYANVYRFHDTFYNKVFALKRAKPDLNEKEIERFKREFIEMSEFSSPYIVEVFCYNKTSNEYIMEYMDSTLNDYIIKNNATLSDYQRRVIGHQILKAFEYIHSKNRLHRDISPKNILLKSYDHLIVAKIADFGLVKIPDSTLTSVQTDLKGYFNDPSLLVDGFDEYSVLHETYALTRIVYFVLTGRTNVDKISNADLEAFVRKGLNSDKSLRFQNVSEMIEALKNLKQIS